MGHEQHDHNDQKGLSLQDLAHETGVEPRTIRSYVEKGVIPGPESLGRGATYPRETLDRLKVVKLLRAANRDLTLDQIRVLLHSIGPSRLRAIADGQLRIGALIDTDALAGGPASKRAALDYLHGIKGWRAPQDTMLNLKMSTHAVQTKPLDEAQLTVLENAARALAALAGLSSSARTLRGENWYRISLTPDIELSIRGEFGTEQLAQLHRIGDALRTLLTKGPSQ